MYGNEEDDKEGGEARAAGDIGILDRNLCRDDVPLAIGSFGKRWFDSVVVHQGGRGFTFYGRMGLHY
ncbi:hypothetical protein VTH06DRAFT_4548 [Thermothelomyces fergusii]